MRWLRRMRRRVERLVYSLPIRHPRCLAGRHDDIAVRPGVYECQRPWCMRARKVQSEMDPVAEARSAQALALLREASGPLREARERGDIR